MPSVAMPEGERPAVSLVARAMTMTGLSSLRLMAGWRDALRMARLDPGYSFGGRFEAGMLLHVLKREGADAAFWEWARTKVEQPVATAAPLPAPRDESRIGIPEDAVILKETPGYRMYETAWQPKPAVRYPTAEEQEAMYQQLLAERAAREAKAAAPRPTPPAPPAFTFRKPSPPVARPAPAEDPFEGGGKVLEFSDDIPF